MFFFVKFLLFKCSCGVLQVTNLKKRAPIFWFLIFLYNWQLNAFTCYAIFREIFENVEFLNIKLIICAYLSPVTMGNLHIWNIKFTTKIKLVLLFFMDFSIILFFGDCPNKIFRFEIKGFIAVFYGNVAFNDSTFSSRWLSN